jgi:hypothetical protein
VLHIKLLRPGRLQSIAKRSSLFCQNVNDQEKRFYYSGTYNQCDKTFFSVIEEEAKQARALVYAKPFQPNPIFEIKAGAYTSGTTFKCSPLG